MSQFLNFSNSTSGFFSRVHPALRNILLLLLLLSASVGIGLLIITKGITIGLILLGVIIGVPLVWTAFGQPMYALFYCIIFSYLNHLIRRVSGNYDLPVGSVGDAMLIIGALGILFRKSTAIQPIWNIITILYAITLGYIVLQVLNPNVNNLSTWLSLGLRSTILNLSTFALAVHAFNSKKDVKKFTVFVLAMALIAALYGIYQEFAGLPGYDLAWVMSSEQRFKLIFINGHFRKWSMLGAVSAYGVIMAYSAITALILAIGPFKVHYRILLLVAAFCMMTGMLYSGTRTAYVMVPIGIFFFILLTIRERRTIIFTVFAFIVGGGLMFGPFYGGSLSRLRTAFEPDKDASMQVREQNRDRIQPYMWSHPFGGGIGTTSESGTANHPGHPLAGFPPDSGFMQTVLETGYIGFIISLTLYFVTLRVGVKNFFKTRDPAIKYYYVAYMAAFFAITFGNLAQNAVSYPPADVINICIMVLMFRLIFLDTNTSSTANKTKPISEVTANS